MIDDVYIGCRQVPATINEQIVKVREELFAHLTSDTNEQVENPRNSKAKRNMKKSEGDTTIRKFVNTLKPLYLHYECTSVILEGSQIMSQADMTRLN